MRSTRACWRSALDVPLGHDGPERGRSRQDRGHVLEAALALGGPVVLRVRLAPPRAPSYGQDADARGAAPLVGRRGERGPALGEGEPPGRGAGVDEERYAVEPRGELGHGLHRADLVVGGLAGDDGGVLEVEGVEDDPRLGVDGERAGGAPRPGRGLQDRRVLDGGVHDRVAMALGAAVEPEEAAVHRLGARRREGHLVGPQPECLGRHGPGVVEDEPGGATGVVEPPGVGVGRVRAAAKGLARGRMQGFPGGRVEVRPATVLRMALGG